MYMEDFKEIDGELKWIRYCPNCGIEILHKQKKQRNFLRKNGLKCRSCGTKTGNINRDKSYYSSVEYKKKLSDAATGHTHTEETKRKLSEAARKNNPMYNSEVVIRQVESRQEKWMETCQSTDHRRNLRLKAIKRIEEHKLNGNQLCPAFNPKACNYLDLLSKQKGWDIQHAMNGGEYRISDLGYWVDGYDKGRNIVIEYDEPFHDKHTEKDLRRQHEIIEHLGCEFYRYKESKKTLIKC